MFRTAIPVAADSRALNGQRTRSEAIDALVSLWRNRPLLQEHAASKRSVNLSMLNMPRCWPVTFCVPCAVAQIAYGSRWSSVM